MFIYIKFHLYSPISNNANEVKLLRKISRKLVEVFHNEMPSTFVFFTVFLTQNL